MPSACGWAPRHLSSGCDGCPGHCAGGHPSANTARTWPGGFAPQWNSSNLQAPHGPGCLLAYLYLPEPRELGFPLHCIKWEESPYR